MNNADKPAYPAEQAIPYEYEDFCEFSGESTIQTAYKDAKGLTKREKFAMAAMQGLLSNDSIIDQTAPEWISREAVKQADALLKELGENND